MTHRNPGSSIAAAIAFILVGCGDATQPSNTGPESLNTLAVSIAGDATVTSSPTGISCSTGNTGGCSAGFGSGTTVVLTPTPATAAWMLRGWTGACLGAGPCSIEMRADRAATVVFTDTTAPGIISTVAGAGEEGYGGDGGRATDALLYHPWGIAFDSTGAMYIGDTGNQRIRKVMAGVITTVAGSGATGVSAGGFAGDGGPATAAALNRPAGVALDSSGNLYIADSKNHRIRKLDLSGIITTVAGSGPPDSGAFGGDGGPATAARLNMPEGVVVDPAGNLFIGDRYNNRVRKVDVNGVITTIAGTDSFGYSGDGGPAVDAWLSWPSGLALDNAGNLYIADRLNGAIRRIDTAGIITSVGVGLTDPSSVSLDGNGNLYVTERTLHRVVRVDLAGNVQTVAGTGEWGYNLDWIQANRAQLHYPIGLTIGPDGHLYIADTINHRVRLVKR